MKIIFFLLLLAICNISYAQDNYTNQEIANAIYKAEGGKKAKKPFGILSVECNRYKECRQICLNTIKNNRKRYQDYGYKQYDTFLEFLASRYAPIKSHPLNEYWLKNVLYFLNKN